MITDKWLFYIIVSLLPLHIKSAYTVKNPTAFDIFCKGPILHAVQKSGLYTDCKRFVNMKMKFLPSIIILKFNKMMNDYKGRPKRVQIRRFVRECFAPPGIEYDRHVPGDWVERPAFLLKIRDRLLRKWAKELNGLWKRMVRNVTYDVKKQPNLYTSIYLPNPMIISGGKYTEFNYFQSYWVILGLLRCGMTVTVKGMLDNFVEVINKYGFVPNGGRIYYLTRSNLPLFIPMVLEYFKTTNDTDYIKNNIAVLEKEFKFWIKNRTVTLSNRNKTFPMGRYYSDKESGPRPEAYNEDTNAAAALSTSTKKKDFYMNIRGACESGWEFSSRWYKNNGTNTGTLIDTQTSTIIPVDLNAVLCWNAYILSNFFKLLEMDNKAAYYEALADDWKNALFILLWDDDDGIWYDYDIKLKKPRKYYYASNMFPLWTGCYDQTNNETGPNVVNYLRKLGIDKFKGGIPTSLLNTGQYWDFPSAIPSLQHVVITGLRRTNNDEAMKLARSLAQHWIRANYRGYLSTKRMYGMYYSNVSGKMLGEKKPDLKVTDYSWTNGVCLELLCEYGKVLKAHDKAKAPYLHASIIFVLVVCALQLNF